MYVSQTEFDFNILSRIENYTQREKGGLNVLWDTYQRHVGVSLLPTRFNLNILSRNLSVAIQLKYFELKEKNALSQTFNGSKFSGIRFLCY